jgi:AcrR family transcriptional regulator
MAISDPRFLRSRQAILDAARTLLVDRGPASVTHVQVAHHAGVGRATVYRHWPRSEDLLAEAMAAVPMPFFATPSSPVRQWLLAELGALARQLEQDEVRAVTTTLANAALWDREMDARRERFARTLSERLAAALVTAEGYGEVQLHGDAAQAAATTIGPLYYRSTIEHQPIDDEMMFAVVEALGRWRDNAIPTETA